MAVDYQKSYELLWVGLIAGFVLMLIGGSLEIGWLLWLGAAVFMAAVLQTLLFFRCPHCGGHWDARSGIPHYCPECGEPLVFEEGCNICKSCGWSKCH